MTTLRIDGATRLYGIIGNPIVQVRSPETFSAAFAARGVNAVMLPIQILPDQLDVAVRGLMALRNLDGLLVTVPYKTAMVRYAARLGATARCIGAVNALRREADDSWTADIFDGAGFVVGAQRKGNVLAGRRVALFGAGGAGSAIACELAAAGAASIALIDPRRDRAEALAAALAASFPDCRASPAGVVPADANMVVNASTVGMKPADGLPGELGPLARDTLIGDVINTDARTPIIEHAIRHGCPYVTGKDMHAGQGEALLGFFAAATRADAAPVAH